MREGKNREKKKKSDSLTLALNFTTPQHQASRSTIKHWQFVQFESSNIENRLSAVFVDGVQDDFSLPETHKLNIV